MIYNSKTIFVAKLKKARVREIEIEVEIEK